MFLEKFFPQQENLSCNDSWDGFLIKYYTTTLCNIAHKDSARANIKLEALNN